MTSDQVPPIRARLNALLDNIHARGLCTGRSPAKSADGTIVGDALAVADATGIEFTTVGDVINAAEETLFGFGDTGASELRVGDVCEVISPVCVRREEDLGSEVVMERLPQGTRLEVLEVSSVGRPRIRISEVDGRALDGWVSVRTCDGDMLLEKLEVGSWQEARAIDPIEDLNAGLAALGTGTSSFVCGILDTLAEQASQIAEQAQDGVQLRRQLVQATEPLQEQLRALSEANNKQLDLVETTRQDILQVRAEMVQGQREWKEAEEQSRLSCMKVWPAIGDTVWNAQDQFDGQWTLGADEVAAVVEVDADGDFRLRNPGGEVSPRFMHRRYFRYVKEPQRPDAWHQLASLRESLQELSELSAARHQALSEVIAAAQEDQVALERRRPELIATIKEQVLAGVREEVFSMLEGRAQELTTLMDTCREDVMIVKQELAVLQQRLDLGGEAQRRLSPDVSERPEVVQPLVQAERGASGAQLEALELEVQRWSQQLAALDIDRKGMENALADVAGLRASAQRLDSEVASLLTTISHNENALQEVAELAENAKDIATGASEAMRSVHDSIDELSVKCQSCETTERFMGEEVRVLRQMCESAEAALAAREGHAVSSEQAAQRATERLEAQVKLLAAKEASAAEQLGTLLKEREGAAQSLARSARAAASLEAAERHLSDEKEVVRSTVGALQDRIAALERVVDSSGAHGELNQDLVTLARNINVLRQNVDSSISNNVLQLELLSRKVSELESERSKPPRAEQASRADQHRIDWLEQELGDIQSSAAYIESADWLRGIDPSLDGESRATAQRRVVLAHVGGICHRLAAVARVAGDLGQDDRTFPLGPSLQGDMELAAPYCQQPHEMEPTEGAPSGRQSPGRGGRSGRPPRLPVDHVSGLAEVIAAAEQMASSQDPQCQQTPPLSQPAPESDDVPVPVATEAAGAIAAGSADPLDHELDSFSGFVASEEESEGRSSMVVSESEEGGDEESPEREAARGAAAAGEVGSTLLMRWLDISETDEQTGGDEVVALEADDQTGGGEVVALEEDRLRGDACLAHDGAELAPTREPGGQAAKKKGSRASFKVYVPELGVASHPSSSSTAGADPQHQGSGGGASLQASIAGKFNVTEILDPDTMKLTAGPRMCTQRSSMGAAAHSLSGRIFFFGGYSAVGQAELDTVEVLDLSDMCFSSTLHMNSPRSGCAAVSLDVWRTLVIGGSDGRGCLDTTEVLNLTVEPPEFELGPRMVSRRSNCAVARLDASRVLIAGGIGCAGVLNSTEILDLETMTFSPGPTMRARRNGCAAVSLDAQRVLIAGGFDGACEVKTTEVLDISSMTFSTGPSMKMERCDCAMATLDSSHILVAGGCFEALETTEVLDVKSMTFSLGPDLCLGRSGCSAVKLETGLLLIAGGSTASLSSPSRSARSARSTSSA